MLPLSRFYLFTDFSFSELLFLFTDFAPLS
jgi:hypothetical protein